MTVLDNISGVAPQLYSEKLIPEETFINAITSNKTGREKANSLLLALKATIDIQPHLIKTLIEVLKKSKVFEPVADKMEKEVLATLL